MVRKPPSKASTPLVHIIKYVYVAICLLAHKYPRIWLLFGCICAAAVVIARPATAERSSNAAPNSTDPAALEDSGVPVEIDGQPIFLVYAQIGTHTPQERAESIGGRVVAFAKRRDVNVNSVHAEDRGTWTEILAGNDRLMGITQADADAAEHERSELAAEYVEIIRRTVGQYREEHSTRRILEGLGYALIVSLAGIIVLVLLFRMREHAHSYLEHVLVRSVPSGEPQAFRSKLAYYLGQPAFTLSRIAFWVLILALVQAVITIVLRFFPSSRYMSYQITGWVGSTLANLWKSAIAYIPDLIVLWCICFAAAFAIRVNHFIFREVRDERLRIHGFYPDWAEPTAKLVRTLLVIGAAIIAFPYMPGSNSPAFKGISVFLGVLLSLGSTSAVAHAVSGTILTYMRAFQVGDFVRIGSDVGEVVEKTLLVTRIRSQKNEVITIPNGTVLGGVVTNYSAEGRKRGVIFHTVVTIGYSAAWRQVHSLLIAAAGATEDVLLDPPPFVLQTALNDFYVSYELNAYTARPMNMLEIYSKLHQNIQDNFNEAGVEIASPHYMSLRDGNSTTVPTNYLSRDYRHPVFEFQASTNVSPGKAGNEKRKYPKS